MPFYAEYEFKHINIAHLLVGLEAYDDNDDDDDNDNDNDDDALAHLLVGFEGPPSKGKTDMLVLGAA